jgi:hypothetical protein
MKCIFISHHVIFPTQFESTKLENLVKIYGRNIEQCTGWNPNPNWALDNSGFFHLWSTSSGFRSHYFCGIRDFLILIDLLIINMIIIGQNNYLISKK